MVPFFFASTGCSTAAGWGAGLLRITPATTPRPTNTTVAAAAAQRYQGADGRARIPVPVPVLSKVVAPPQTWTWVVAQRRTVVPYGAEVPVPVAQDWKIQEEEEVAPVSQKDLKIQLTATARPVGLKNA